MIKLLSLFVAFGTLLIMLIASLRRPFYLVKPSFIFLLLFTLQVQISSAINISEHLSQMVNPWVYFLCIHGFGLVALIPALFLNNNIANFIFEELGNLRKLKNVKQIFLFVVGFLIIEYIVLLAYFDKVPFQNTGLYAILFDLEMLDSYRELSMKLLKSDLLRYSYVLMEKVIAPVAASLYALFFMVLWINRKKRIYALLSVVLLLLILFPALIYGARGPVAMILLAAFYSLFLVYIRRFSLVFVVLSIFGILAFPIMILVVKNHVYTGEAVLFQSLNAIDRSIGRSYIDNVWHYQYFEKNGAHGIQAVEKIAKLIGTQPIDSSNIIAKSNQDNGRSFGLSLLESGAPLAKPPDLKSNSLNYASSVEPNDSAMGVEKVGSPTLPSDFASNPLDKASSLKSGRSIGDAIKCDEKIRRGCIDVSLTGTSTGSFAMMNYVIFGWFGLFLSIAVVFLIDGLLYAYRHITGFMLLPAVGAIIVPILGLSFSLLTTTLASRGLLLIPLLCFVASKLIRNVDNNSNS